MDDARFAYLEPVATKYGVVRVQIIRADRTRDVHEFMDKLTPEDLQALAQTYREIAKRNDAEAISDYVLGPRSSDLQQRVFLLMRLFDRLGERGVMPFSDGAVRLVEKEAKLDWSKLPESLRYLAEPAQRYGGLQFDDAIMQCVDQMDQAERRRLLALGRRMQRQKKEIDAFLDRYPMTEHPESSRVYFLMGLIDAVPKDN